MCERPNRLTSTAPRRTCLPTFNSSLSMVVVISAHLPTEHSLFHAHVPLSRRQKLCCRRTACVEQFTGYYKTDHSPATDSLANIWKHFYSGPRNRSALWLLTIVRYTTTLTYLPSNHPYTTRPGQASVSFTPATLLWKIPKKVILAVLFIHTSFIRNSYIWLVRWTNL